MIFERHGIKDQHFFTLMSEILYIKPHEPAPHAMTAFQLLNLPKSEKLKSERADRVITRSTVPPCRGKLTCWGPVSMVLRQEGSGN